MAAFMEVLDTSIANVALPHIAGDLGASNDESTWVLTSYLVSNAIVLPISGWLATLFGRKRFFLLCIFLFTLSSLLCGVAPSLAMLILFRVIKAPAAADCSRWRRPFWPTRSRRRNAAWRSRSTASPPSWRPPSARRWAAGSPTIIPGAGFSTSICRSAF